MNKRIRRIAFNCFRKLFFVILFFLQFQLLFSQEVTINGQSFPLSIGDKVQVLIDTNSSINVTNVTKASGFIESNKKVPIYASSNNDIWIRFKVRNTSNYKNLFLSIKSANVSNIWFYQTKSGKLDLLRHTGNAVAFNSREDNDADFNFTLASGSNDSAQEYYLHIQSKHPLEIPLIINSIYTLGKSSFEQNVIVGIYCGIILSTLLYNLFLFVGTRDKSYLVYVAYLFVLGFAQITFAGWSFKIFWPQHPQLNTFIVIDSSCLAGIMGIAFAKSFLQTQKYTPILDKILNLLIFSYLVAVVLSFTSSYWLSYQIFNYTGLSGGLILFLISIIIYRKGFRAAYFYLLAWSVFLVGLIVYLLKNLSIIPTNNFTHFILYFGSAIEAILLSIALADKINVLQKEKEVSQAEALKISQENETLVREQNIVLERRVTERTEKLAAANDQLNHTLNDLKDAQAQLVDAEKMASLGQLTAGIAHEINNPINFVKSNIKPLQLDINDLFHVIDQYDVVHSKKDGELQTALKSIDQFKKEIDIDYVKTEIKNLIKGIEEGAERTAEIVRGLRTFSRLDEAELKAANVHDGLDSTLVLLKNSIPPHIKIVKNYKANGEIECYAGKLNQVFMNIINNGVQAILGKKQQDAEEYITISTRDIPGDKIEISIKDSGMGMTEEVKQKIFEPFFTTKAVGEGTGLGMAIVFKIIENHHAKININSSPGNGAEFILTLPHMQPLS